MSKGTVVDTCAIVRCFSDLLVEEDTEFTQFLELVFARGFIAIDSEGRALQEYFDTAKPGALREGISTWIADQVRLRRIVEFDLDNSHSNALRQQGLPPKDTKWIAIALGSESRIIATEDIDLFDPSEKGCSAKRREKIMSSSTGRVAKYCKKKLGVVVTTCKNMQSAVDSVDGVDDA